jgi:hypothetical protein
MGPTLLGKRVVVFTLTNTITIARMDADII